MGGMALDMGASDEDPRGVSLTQSVSAERRRLIQAAQAQHEAETKASEDDVESVSIDALLAGIARRSTAANEENESEQEEDGENRDRGEKEDDDEDDSDGLVSATLPPFFFNVERPQCRCFPIS